jgi:hypothetical protein
MVNLCRPDVLPLKVKTTHPTLIRRTFYAQNSTLLAVLEPLQLEEVFDQLTQREVSVTLSQLLTIKLSLTTSCKPLVPQV